MDSQTNYQGLALLVLLAIDKTPPSVHTTTANPPAKTDRLKYAYRVPEPRSASPLAKTGALTAPQYRIENGKRCRSQSEILPGPVHPLLERLRETTG